MDRQAIFKELTATLFHLGQIIDHIKEQRSAIADLEAQDRLEDLAEARLLLRDLETIRAGYFSDRNRLIQYLAEAYQAASATKALNAIPKARQSLSSNSARAL